MNWRTIRRETGLVEHLCEHGVGHPNRGSALWLAEEYPEEGYDLDDCYGARLIHGCDRCCGRDDFPGTLFNSLRHAHGIIREQNKSIEDLERQVGDFDDELRVAAELADMARDD